MSINQELDSFMPPAASTEQETRDYNLPIYGTYGEFTLAPEVKVPYMVALMDLKRLTKELKTHEEVSPSLDSTYSLTELFQREIDVDRVEDEIINRYLKDPAKLKFFNALTMVLLPKDEAGRIQSDFEDYPDNDPVVPDPMAGKFDQFFVNSAWTKAVFGGVQFISTQTANISRLRWDSRRVDAVAVDGQHRLKALKVWMQKKNNELVDIEKPTRVPIIFLLLHKKAGFLQAGSSAGLRAIAREIFTDLNKNAKEVDLATQIVLDDRSVESLCVRSLVTQSTGEDSPPLLPLTMVRWQEANNRFDQRYFLNSLVHLHSIVEELLDMAPPRKIDKDAGSRFVEKVQKTLGVGTPPKLVSHDKSLDQYYADNYLDESGDAVAPINGIPPSFLAPAVQGFQERFSTWLLKLLTQFEPYKQVMDYARSNEIISGEFGKYLAQPKSHQNVLVAELQARHGDDWFKVVVRQHEEAILKIKGTGRSEDQGGEYWAFKAIFQKAFVKLGKSLFFDIPEAERARFGSVDEFLDFFGTLHLKGCLAVHSKITVGEHRHGLWTFISVNAINKKIQVVGTAERRMLALMTIVYFCRRYSLEAGKQLVVGQTTDDSELSIKAVIDKLGQKGSTSTWPNAPTYVNELLAQYINSIELIDPTVADKTSKKAKLLAEQRLNAVVGTFFNFGADGVSPPLVE